jgi:hypothetical protein
MEESMTNENEMQMSVPPNAGDTNPQMTTPLADSVEAASVEILDHLCKSRALVEPLSKAVKPGIVKRYRGCGPKTLGYLDGILNLIEQDQKLVNGFTGTEKIRDGVRDLKRIRQMLAEIDRIEAFLKNISASVAESTLNEASIYHALLKISVKQGTPGARVYYDELKTRLARGNQYSKKTATEAAV